MSFYSRVQPVLWDHTPCAIFLSTPLLEECTLSIGRPQQWTGRYRRSGTMGWILPFLVHLSCSLYAATLASPYSGSVNLCMMRSVYTTRHLVGIELIRLQIQDSVTHVIHNGTLHPSLRRSDIFNTYSVQPGRSTSIRVSIRSQNF